MNVDFFKLYDDDDNNNNFHGEKWLASYAISFIFLKRDLSTKEKLHAWC